jgi:hypothetical protein
MDKEQWDLIWTGEQAFCIRKRCCVSTCMLPDANMHVPAPSMHVTEIAHVNMMAILACMFKTPTWHYDVGKTPTWHFKTPTWHFKTPTWRFKTPNMGFQNSNMVFQNSNTDMNMHVSDTSMHVTDVNMINTSLFEPSKTGAPPAPHCAHP